MEEINKNRSHVIAVANKHVISIFSRCNFSFNSFLLRIYWKNFLGLVLACFDTFIWRLRFYFVMSLSQHRLVVTWSIWSSSDFHCLYLTYKLVFLARMCSVSFLIHSGVVVLLIRFLIWGIHLLPASRRMLVKLAHICSVFLFANTDRQLFLVILI